MKFLSGMIGLLCMAQAVSAQFSEATMVRRTTKVNISVLAHNTVPRQFKKLLIIGAGGFISHNTWERVCMELKESLESYAVSARYEFLPSDTIAARKAYEQLLKGNDFDAVLNFTANGDVTLNAKQILYYNNNFGPSNAPAGVVYTLNNTQAERRLIAGQDWNLVLFAPGGNIIWQAQMHTQVVETERKSYRRVSQEMLAALQADQLVPAGKKHSG